MTQSPIERLRDIERECTRCQSAEREARRELQDLRDRYEEHFARDIAEATKEKDAEIARLTRERDAANAGWDAEQKARFDETCAWHARLAGVARERDAAREALREACALADHYRSVVGLVECCVEVRPQVVVDARYLAVPEHNGATTADLRRRGGIDG